MPKYLEKPLEVNATQFRVNEPWPDGVHELEAGKHIYAKHLLENDYVAYIYSAPDPYINYLEDGDWIVEHDEQRWVMTNKDFEKRFMPKIRKNKA